MMTLHPIDDRIIVRRLDAEKTYKGVIYIPETAKDPKQIGVIIAAGPGIIGPDGERITLQVQKGDRVLFGKYAGTDVTVNEEKLTIIKEIDILCTVTGEEDDAAGNVE